jgi:cysteine desulfurase/selenocysteine lyase
MSKVCSAAELRSSFPILATTVHGYPLAYLDNAATTQKPQSVIEAFTTYYTQMNANIHRGVHALSERATLAYEEARQQLAAFFGVRAAECIFTTGTTAAINLLAATWGEQYLQPGDTIIVSQLEHHANILPWQQLAIKKQLKLKVWPLAASGVLLVEDLLPLFDQHTKLLAVTHVSNVTGAVSPLQACIPLAKAANIAVFVDGTQAPAHMPVDIGALGCDFYAVSAHKMYGPMGIGLLFMQQQWLEHLPPYQTGGGIVLQVAFDAPPQFVPGAARFEPGTMNVAAVLAFRAAVEFLQSLPLAALWAEERALLAYALQQLQSMPHITVFGHSAQALGIISFLSQQVHAHDLATILDRYGVAIRAGHHCAMPLMQHWGIAGTARLSLAVYNTRADVDQLLNALEQAHALFKVKTHTWN